ncbi:MAG: hypothetical protein RJA76_175 [Bacteroidota bacterium]|jgi:hypothetical protein
MKREILLQIENPSELERLYQSNKKEFKQSFDILYPEISEKPMAKFWQERLHYVAAIKKIIDWRLLVVLAFSMGLLMELPKFTGWNEEAYYGKYIGIILFGGLAIFSTLINRAEIRVIAILTIVFLSFAGYISYVQAQASETIFILCAIHLAGIMAFIVAISRLGNRFNEASERILYLKYVGDLLIISGLILLCVGLFSALTINLFEAIQVKISEFYPKYILWWLLAPIPVVGAYLLESNSNLVSKISPIIAKIFSPLALVSLVAFFIAFLTNENQTIRDRDFLLLFNGVLVAVLALIFFTIANQETNSHRAFGTIVVCLLSLVAICINGIALYAILERINEFGFSPNRVAVLGSNFLILIHLVLAAIQLFISSLGNKSSAKVQEVMVSYLPIYFFWFVFVCFFFPVIF